MADIYAQTSLFNDIIPKYRITKPIRLIELFAGIGAQFKALKQITTNVESYKICEWAYNSFCSYNAIHIKDFTDYAKDMSKDELIEKVNGISTDYNNPLTVDQLQKKNIEWLKIAYNNIKATHNLVNIMNVKASDLEIVDTDKYDYVMTYSFPCQDLSLAGKGKGMSVSQADGGTRSGLLWEVERILSELYDNKMEMPKILIMENVPEVIGTKNLKDFEKWELKLSKLGYSNFIKILNAKDYYISQNRRRCFMVSILGNYTYDMPIRMELKYYLKDFLEPQVDEKYFLSEKMINGMKKTNFESYKLENKMLDINGVCPTIIARYEGAPFVIDNALLIPEATKKGYAEAHEGDGIYINRPHQKRGVVQKGMIQTIKTSCDDIGVVVKEENMKTKLCNALIENGIVKENDVIRHSYSSNRLNNGEKNLKRVESKENNICPTLDTRCDCLCVVVKDNYLGTYQFAKSDNFMQGQDRFKKDSKVCGALLTSPKEGVVVLGNYSPKVIGGVGEKDSNNGTQWKMQNRIYDNKVGVSIATSFNPYYVDNSLRIRKLTPKECYRLMGFQDCDYQACKDIGMGDSAIYHMAGDSIVVSCLIALFGPLFAEPSKHREIIKDYVERVKENETIR